MSCEGHSTVRHSKVCQKKEAAVEAMIKSTIAPTSNKHEMIKILQDLFIQDNHGDAFDEQLLIMLENINSDEVPSNLSTFYYTYLKKDEKRKKDIKTKP